MENKKGIMSACCGSARLAGALAKRAVGGEKISKTKLINFSAVINNGWHWHVQTVFAGHAFVLEKTL